MEKETLSLMFSSKKEDWGTPAEFFEIWREKYDLEVDVCANEKNHKLPLYWTEEENGLNQDWSGLKCWMNPPYGRGITEKWVEKAATETALTVCLLPARTDTSWFHNIVWKCAEAIYFIKGRIKFEGAESGAPFPSMVVVFNRLPGYEGRRLRIGRPEVETYTLEESNKDDCKGFFCVVEGIDGSGKTYLLDKIYEYIVKMNIPTVKIKEPGASGHIVPEESSPDKYIASMIKTDREIVRPALEKGSIVLCDRWYYSTMAYQGKFPMSKNKGGINAKIRKELVKKVSKPDLVVHLKLNPIECINRIYKRDGLKDINPEKVERHYQLHRNYTEIINGIINSGDNVTVLSSEDKNERYNLKKAFGKILEGYNKKIDKEVSL